MRIAKIHIDGFGIFHDLGVDGISEGLSLFHGPNEAGKTTLLAFLRSILFGFPDGRSNENAYHPLRGGVHGGQIVLVGQDEERYTVDRRPGPHGGKLTVTLPNGQLADHGALQSLLGYAGRDLYRNVFAFSLKELQHFGSLDDAAVGSAIYSAGAGAGVRSLPEVAKSLEKAMGAIFKPGGSKPVVNRILKELEACRGGIRERLNRVDDYDRARGELEGVESQIEELELKKVAHRRRRDRARGRLQVWEEWVSLKSCEEELSRLPEISDFPPDAVNRLEALEGKTEDVKARIGRMEGDIRALEAERKGLTVNQRLLEREPEILQLQRGRDHYDKARADLPLREQERETAQRRVTEVLRGIGPEWNTKRLKHFDTSIPVREVIRKYRREMEDTRNSLQIVRTRLVDEEKRLERAEESEAQARKAVSDLAVSGETDPGRMQEMREDARRLRSFVRLSDSLNERLAGLTERRDDFQDQAQRIRGRMQPTGPHLPWYPAVPVLLFLALLSGHLWLASAPGTAVAFGVFGTGVVLAYLILSRWFEKRGNQAKRQAGLEWSSITNRIGKIDEEMDAARRERVGVRGKIAEIAGRLGVDPPTDERAVETIIDGVEGEMNRVRRWRNAEESLAETRSVRLAAQEICEGLKGDVRAAEEALARAQRSWQEWLASVGLPGDVTPDGALEVVTRVQECRDRQETVEGLDERIDLMRREISGYERSVEALWDACRGETDEATDAGTRVDRLIERLKETQRQASRHESITERLARLVDETGLLTAEREEAMRRLQALLKEGGARTAEELRKRASVWESRVELQRKIKENTRALERVAGRGKHLEAFKAALSETRPEEEEALKAAAEDGLEGVSAALAVNLDRRGALREKLRVMETESDVGTLRLKEEGLLARLNQWAWKWGRLALAKALLSEARARYERERQPGVIKDAGAYFKVMTGGRYSRILAPVGETTLHVMDRKDVRKPLETLSRGTREQLYLSVRLGLIEEFCKHHEPLPIVLDDIFVNFDRRRADAAVEVMTNLAASHQVLVFTCHRDTCRRFRETSPSVRLFEIRDGAIEPENRGHPGNAQHPA